MYNTAKLKTMLLWMQSFLHPGEVVLCTCGLLHVKSFAQCHHTTRSVRSHRPTRSVPHHRGGGYLAQPCKGWSPNHQLPIWHWKFCSLSQVFNPDRALYKSTPQTGGEKVSEHSVLAPLSLREQSSKFVLVQVGRYAAVLALSACHDFVHRQSVTWVTGISYRTSEVQVHYNSNVMRRAKLKQ